MKRVWSLSAEQNEGQSVLVVLQLTHIEKFSKISINVLRAIVNIKNIDNM